MASIIERKSKKNPNKVSYRVQVSVRTTDGRRTRLSETFERKAAAEKWAKRMEDESDRNGVDLHQETTPETIGDLITHYLAEKHDKIGSSKLGCLRTIKDMEIGQVRCTDLNSKHVTDMCRTLAKRTVARKDGERPISPATVQTYLSNLSSVLKLAVSSYGTTVDDAAIRNASHGLKHLEIIDASAQRERRPTLEELDLLMHHFGGPKASKCAPMQKMIAFAIFSSRRLGEVPRLEWKDYRPETKMIRVRQMKSPKNKKKNDRWVILPDKAIQIIESMPRTSPFIFPFNHDSIGTAWSEACKALGIEDLHFHDLRHEAISHLFELGWSVMEIMQVSGHTTLASLERYNQYRARSDAYKDWRWMDAVTRPQSDEETKIFEKVRKMAERRRRQRDAQSERMATGKPMPKAQPQKS